MPTAQLVVSWNPFQHSKMQRYLRSSESDAPRASWKKKSLQMFLTSKVKKSPETTKDWDQKQMNIWYQSTEKFLTKMLKVLVCPFCLRLLSLKWFIIKRRRHERKIFHQIQLLLFLSSNLLTFNLTIALRLLQVHSATL